MKRRIYRFPEDYDEAPEGQWFYMHEGLNVVINDLTTDPPTVRRLNGKARKGGKGTKSSRVAPAVRAAKAADKKSGARRSRSK